MTTNDYKKLTDRYLSYLEGSVTEMRESFKSERRLYFIVICALAGVNVAKFTGVI